RVAGECSLLYARVHPGEPLGLSRFYLDARRRASLLQGAHFQGHPDVPPQAYFSDAHLDTLGFCLFLALSKLTAPGDTIVALDDAFTSADDAHQERLEALLIEESAAFRQVIATTHSHAWRDRCRRQEIQGAPVQLVELAPWSAAEGIRVMRET